MQICVCYEEAAVLGFCAMLLGNWLPMFRMNVPPASSGLWVRELTHNGPNPEYEGGRFVRKFGNPLPAHMAQHPRRSVSSTTVRLKQWEYLLEKSEALSRSHVRLPASQMISVLVRDQYNTPFCWEWFALFTLNPEKNTSQIYKTLKTSFITVPWGEHRISYRLGALNLPEALDEDGECTGLSCTRRTEENAEEIRKIINERWRTTTL